MSIIFFNSPLGTPKVQFVNTDKSKASLKKAGVIPEGAATLTIPMPKTDEGLAKLAHVDKLTFDDMKNPTDVVWDMDLVDMFWKDVYRDCRVEIMGVLDILQQRGLVKGLTDVVSQIEEDKQALRDLPEKIDYSTYSSFVETCLHSPEEFFVDYEAKYIEALS